MNSIHYKKGEIATAITLAAFVFVTASAIVSNVFLGKNKQTTSSLALSTPACASFFKQGLDNQGYLPVANVGEYCILCTGNQGPCEQNAGVGVPYQYEAGGGGSSWVIRNKAGECNETCRVGTVNPTTPQSYPTIPAGGPTSPPPVGTGCGYSTSGKFLPNGYCSPLTSTDTRYCLNGSWPKNDSICKLGNKFCVGNGYKPTGDFGCCSGTTDSSGSCSLSGGGSAPTVPPVATATLVPTVIPLTVIPTQQPTTPPKKPSYTPVPAQKPPTLVPTRVATIAQDALVPTQSAENPTNAVVPTATITPTERPIPTEIPEKNISVRISLNYLNCPPNSAGVLQLNLSGWWGPAKSIEYNPIKYNSPFNDVFTNITIPKTATSLNLTAGAIIEKSGNTDYIETKKTIADVNTVPSQIEMQLVYECPPLPSNSPIPQPTSLPPSHTPTPRQTQVRFDGLKPLYKIGEQFYVTAFMSNHRDGQSVRLNLAEEFVKLVDNSQATQNIIVQPDWPHYTQISWKLEAIKASNYVGMSVTVLPDNIFFEAPSFGIIPQPTPTSTPTPINSPGSCDAKLIGNVSVGIISKNITDLKINPHYCVNSSSECSKSLCIQKYKEYIKEYWQGQPNCRQYQAWPANTITLTDDNIHITCHNILYTPGQCIPGAVPACQ